MNDAFAYAESQLLGTQFDPFVYVAGGVRYTWRGQASGALALLVRVGLRSAARWLFGRLVEVR